ncbi:hypothetical protein SAMN05444166_7766 [Singulisphaera sp. GP187]|uniref:hypothetical protein n=1 Tax=Singulisphaera sp. GP187 TaxID=1882752 RepID=UPI0009273B1A|nr:hypothetical protein [Singulisphaera sp. GP187]SIO65624.1 hypothetical protein SAMN05444166_7766 [Singulisphaera sp. GP187]
MQGRSWMAALTVAVGIVLPLARSANADEKPATKTNTVYILLNIAGLDAEGCDVEIKPGHSGCQFRPIRQHVNQGGQQTVRLTDVKTSSADRECAFSITIREAGQANRTFRRGLRLASPETAPYSAMECFISSPSKLAKAEQAKRTR